VKFCPKCGTRLKLKQIKGERGVSITYLCDNDGYTDKAGKTVMQTTEDEQSPRSTAPDAGTTKRCGGFFRRGVATSHRLSSTDV